MRRVREGEESEPGPAPLQASLGMLLTCSVFGAEDLPELATFFRAEFLVNPEPQRADRDCCLVKFLHSGVARPSSPIPAPSLPLDYAYLGEITEMHVLDPTAMVCSVIDSPRPPLTKQLLARETSSSPAFTRRRTWRTLGRETPMPARLGDIVSPR